MSTNTVDWILAGVQVVVGTLRVTAWGPTDALKLAPMSDTWSSEPSAGGATVAYSKNSDPRWSGTLTVRRGTVGFKLLYEQYQIQRDATTTVAPLNFRAFDPVAGTTIAEKALRFMRSPDLDFGNDSPVAVFNIELPAPKVDIGTNINASA